MIVSDGAFVMLLVEDRFRDLTKKELADPATHTEAILAFSAESREEVDELADKALAAGGTAANEPMDHGFMYSRSFHDPDGHLWEVRGWRSSWPAARKLDQALDVGRPRP